MLGHPDDEPVPEMQMSHSFQSEVRSSYQTKENVNLFSICFAFTANVANRHKWSGLIFTIIHGNLANVSMTFMLPLVDQ